MRGSRIFLAVLLVMSSTTLISAKVAHAATYYVDCTAGNDANSGQSENQAWQSLQPVHVLNWQAGDTTLLKRGCSWDTGFKFGSLSTNTGLVITQSGTASQPLTLAAYGSGAAPILYNSYSALPYVRALGLNGNYINVNNLHITNTKEHGINIENSSFINIDSVEIDNTGFGINLIGSNNVISNSYIHDLKMFVNDVAADNDTGAVGVVIIGSNNTVRNTVFKRTAAPSTDYGIDGGAVEFFGTGSYTNSSNNVIAYNWIEDSDGVAEFGSTNNATMTNNSFRYNVLVNNGKLLVTHLAGGSTNFSANVSGTTFFNNTVYEDVSQWYLASSRSPGVLIWFSGVPSASSLTLKNNIFITNGVPQFISHATPTHSHNLYNLTGILEWSLGTGELTSPAQIISAAAKDFHLLNDSPARNSGTDLGLQSDYDDNIVPTELLPDIGAFEYQPTASPVPSSSPSTLPTFSPNPSTSPSPDPNYWICAADINLDGRVDLLDFTILNALWFQVPTGYPRADIIVDSIVDVQDFSVLNATWFQTCPAQG